MISYMDCPTAQERLDGFVDGELEVADQVALEWHLRWCRVCTARVADAQAIGDEMRRATHEAAIAGEAARAAYVRDAVLTRLRAERDAQWLTRLGHAVRDRRLLWPALGATTAVLVCMVAMGAVLRAATLETPDSLAGMIAVLANPGSDANPVRLDGRISAPRALGQDQIASAIPDEDMALAVAAVVTREGRVAGYRLLDSSRHPGSAWGDDLDAVLDAVGRTRFTPAQGVSGDPVAVSLVWLVTRTTVRSSTEALQVASPPAVVPGVPMLAPSPATAVDVPVEVPPTLVPADLSIETETGVDVTPATHPALA
jgi:anti-sigma factor RsiW